MKSVWTIAMIGVLAANDCSAGQRGTAREFVDGSTGMRWVLVKDSLHPGGPGRLIAEDSAPAKRQIVIHAGDAVLVEEHSERVDLRLQAVALYPAAAGEVIPVRLRTIGKVIQVRASAPGRAELVTEGSWR